MRARPATLRIIADGGWGLAGHANTDEELVAAARAQIAEPQAQKPDK